MKDSKLIDSSVWIAYITKGLYKEIVELDEVLFLSSLSIFEIKKKLLKDKLPAREVDDFIGFIKQKSIIIDINASIAEQAVKISLEKNIPAIDSLIYSSATAKNLILITKDNDFRGLTSVKILN